MEKLCIKKCKECKGQTCPNYYGGDMHDKYLRWDSYYEAPLHLRPRQKVVTKFLTPEEEDVLYQIDQEEEEKNGNRTLCSGNEKCIYKDKIINPLNCMDKVVIFGGIIAWFITMICGNLV